MRGRLLLLLPLAALLLGCGTAHRRATTPSRPPTSAPPPPSAPLHATFRALTHRPRVNTPWRYVVGANPSGPSGEPIQTQLRVRVRVNRVWLDFGSSTFTGSYQDEISWPPSARGKLLVFEATVAAGGHTKRFRFWLRPR